MKRKRNTEQNRPNDQRWRKKFRHGNDNATDNNDRGPSAGPSSVRNQNQNRNQNYDRNRIERNNDTETFDRKHPMGYKSLETVLKIENDSELILKLSSKKNGFLLLLDQPSIRSDVMCFILAALARASKCSTESSMIQLLVHFYMEIIPKFSSNSNFNRELKVFVANLSNYFVPTSSNRQKYIDAIQDLLIFLRRLQTTIYNNSFDAVRDLMQPITAQIDFVNRKGNTLDEFIIDTMNQLNKSVNDVEKMRDKTEKIEVLMEPPEDFRGIGIYPNKFDILGNHEPFIRKNIVKGKYEDVDHYLDVQFRLLREDFVRPMRGGITQYRYIRNKQEETATKKFRIDDLNIYQNVKIYGSQTLHSNQVQLCRFDCTPFRNLRWQYNKRMMNGSLVCLSPDDFETFFFATVAGHRDPEKLAKGEFQIKLEIESSSMPEITPLINYVMVESHVYFEAYRHNLKVLQGFGTENFPLGKYIVDVNKDISPPSYLTNDSVYLISNRLPDTDPEAKKMRVNMLSNHEWPPCEDFYLDESQYAAFRAALTKQMVVIQGPPGTGKTYIGLRIVEVLLANTTQWPILVVCYTNHALDQFLEGILKFCDLDANGLVRIGGKSQCEALEKHNLSSIKSLMKRSREVPDFIHQSRIESKYKLRFIQEKISFLEEEIEHLTDTVLGDELKSVIKKFNREHYHQLCSSANGRSLSEGILIWLGYAVKMEANQQHINKNNTFNDINYHYDGKLTEEAEIDEEDVKELEGQRIIVESSDEEDEFDIHYSRIHSKPINLDNVVEIDANGFHLVKNNRKSIKQTIQREIKKTETMPQERAKAITNIYSLLPKNRWNLYRLWIELYVQEFERKIKHFRDEYKIEYLRFDGLRKQEDIEIVKKAKIIGMTTTGAAKYRHIIDGTMPKIAIVEEAAEVLEAHIVTALCKQTDHLILIGDHLQLRPNPAVYELAKKFNLEISLFERMINNQMEYYQLEQQHRMRPCISSLLVPHIYKQLLDHPSVENYEDVKGISKNMFFINHRENELAVQETRSHLNVYEAEFIVELCRYIILQGYETSQVTILTTYSGQLHHIRQLMRAHQLLNGVRATIVDNYQGEECDIILLSFVRSNEEGNIGFLKDSHRVNVALSRARKGLYCIGNFYCLAEKSPLWQNLMSDLTAKVAIGDALEIYCQNHTDNKSIVKSKDDFKVAPEGGCSRPCNYRMPCGHSCTRVCHIIDVEHMGVYKSCHKKCDKIICDGGHRCPKSCHYEEDCGKCRILVKKLRIECQHYVQVSCPINPTWAYCSSPCENIRICGHKCKNRCSEPCDAVKCNEMVQAESPCGHTVAVKCFDAKNSSKLLDACTALCGVELKCGHLCKGSCGKCKLGRLHTSCDQKCTRILICGHPCPDKCSVECAPCRRKCTNCCIHSICPLRCGEPCPPCMEKCAWRCKHLRCTKLCSEPCDRELCEYRNTKLIKKCQHPSIGVCGEKMPSLCRVCDKDEVEEIFFGNEDEADARFIELDCDHIVEVKGLIQWMNESKSNSDDNSQISIQFKKCPKCKTIIRRTKALNSFIQASLRDIQQVKLKTSGDPRVNRKTQLNLFGRVDNILKTESFIKDPLRLRFIYEEILKSTNGFRKPNHTLLELNNKLELVGKLKTIYLKFEGREKSQQIFFTEVIEKFNNRLRMAASFIRYYKNCDQQRDDISTEISFLQLMCDVIVKASVQPFNDTGKKLLNDAFELANKYGKATESIRKEFQGIVSEACKHSSGIGITMEEKQMVLKAMGFRRGHWFKCSNGHVYAIGECGGAMQTSTCPECGLTIGGQSHQVTRGNALATEMDGATVPAWPTNLQY